MTFWQRLMLGIKIIFGRYEAPRFYRHPRVGYSEVVLRHKSFAWDKSGDSLDYRTHDWHPLGGRSGEELCTIESRCAGLINHKGGHEWI